ncbi:MAG: hypothetical protein ACMXX9_04855 [Candidatus Woesearchaeota archaeon]
MKNVFFIENLYESNSLNNYFINLLNSFNLKKILIININPNTKENKFLLNEKLEIIDIKLDYFKEEKNLDLKRIIDIKDKLFFLDIKSFKTIKNLFPKKKNSLFIYELKLPLIDKVTKKENFDFDDYFYKLPLLINLEWYAIKNCDKILLLFEHLLFDINKYYSNETKNKKIKKLTLGVDKNTYSFKYNLNNKWLLNSNFNFEEGILSFVNNTSDEYKKFKGCIFGQGKYLDITRKKFKENISFFEELNEKEYLLILQNISFYLVPNIHNDFILEIIQAMSMGKIIITQKNTNIIKNNFNGFEIDYDKECVFKFINNLIKNNVDFKTIAYNSSKSISNISNTTKLFNEELI